MRIDDVLKRMAERVRTSGHSVSGPELDGLVLELFLDAARFALDWESHDECNTGAFGGYLGASPSGAPR